MNRSRGNYCVRIAGAGIRGVGLVLNGDESPLPEREAPSLQLNEIVCARMESGQDAWCHATSSLGGGVFCYI